MTTHHGSRLLIAGVLTCAVAGFAEQSASAQSLKKNQHKKPVTAVGCLQREKDYRRAHGKHDGGFLGTGKGESNEYVLVDAVIGGPSLAIQPASEEDSNCARSRDTGLAFELTGRAEEDDGLKAMIGRRVVISGMLKHAKHDPDTVGTSGTFTPEPTGGHSNHDLELREINVETFSLAPVMQRAAAPEPISPPAFEPAPPAVSAPAPVFPAETPQVAASRPATLPKTATGLPIYGLLGLFSLAAATGLQIFLLRRPRP